MTVDDTMGDVIGIDAARALAGSTLAIVGAGMMAESIIGGLLSSSRSLGDAGARMIPSRRVVGEYRVVTGNQHARIRRFRVESPTRSCKPVSNRATRCRQPIRRG